MMGVTAAEAANGRRRHDGGPPLRIGGRVRSATAPTSGSRPGRLGRLVAAIADWPADGQRSSERKSRTLVGGSKPHGVLQLFDGVVVAIVGTEREGQQPARLCGIGCSGDGRFEAARARRATAPRAVRCGRRRAARPRRPAAPRPAGPAPRRDRTPRAPRHRLRAPVPRTPARMAPAARWAPPRPTRAAIPREGRLLRPRRSAGGSCGSTAR